MRLRHDKEKRVRKTGLYTSHPIPEIESLNPRDHLHGGHDGVDDGEDAAHESKNDGDGDTQDSEEPEAKGHEVGVPQQLLFHCLREQEKSEQFIL